MVPTEFHVSSARLGRKVYVVSLRGEVDLHVAPEVEGALWEAMAAGATRLVVDFSGATFVDSSILGMLTRALTEMRDAGRELVVVGGDRRILRPFELSGLDALIPIEHSLTEALCRLPRAHAVA